MKLLSLLVLLSIGSVAQAAEPTARLPPETPITSTSFVCGNGKSGVIVAIVYTYKDGSIRRFDSDHMFGMTPKQAAMLADASGDSQLYIVPCAFGPVT